jgi:hypothetical protein
MSIFRRYLQILKNKVNIAICEVSQMLQGLYCNKIVTSIVYHITTKLGPSLWDFMIFFISYVASH